MRGDGAGQGLERASRPLRPRLPQRHADRRRRLPRRLHRHSLHLGSAHRDHLLARRTRPPRLRGGARPRLSDRLRHALHLHPHRTGHAPRQRHHLHADRSPHRFREPAGMSLTHQAAAPARHARRFLFVRLTPLTRRRLANFRANHRGYWSLWLFLSIFVVSLFAEFIANDRPILIAYDGAYYMPIFTAYPETAFGGEFPTEADYRDPTVQELIHKKGWMIWPLIPFGARTINYDLPAPAPAPPSSVDWLGTDDQGRDVLARLIYGVRISILFGLTLTALSSVIGVAAGAVQGYFGGLVDLGFQRFIQILSGLPVLFLRIIMASFIEPNFWLLLGLMLLFSWMCLIDVVRAEFLRARNFDYV